MDGATAIRLLFVFYGWCPRNPTGESTLEQHRKQMLVHHWYEGRMYCTDAEMYDTMKGHI